MPMQYFKLLLYLYISFQSFDAFGKASNLLKTCASYPQMFYAIRWHVYAHAASLDSCKRFHCCVLFIRFSVVEQSWCDLKVRSENTPRMKEDVYTAFSLVTTCITIPYIMIFQCHNIESFLGCVDFTTCWYCCRIGNCLNSLLHCSKEEDVAQDTATLIVY